MYSIKLTKYYLRSDDAKKDMPISTSIQIVKGYDKEKNKDLGNRLVNHLYYSCQKLDVLQKNSINKIDNYEEVMTNLSKLNLSKLRNNYYTDINPDCLEHWELEYDMFKIVGTYDNYIEELKQVEEILDFNNIVDNLKKQV